jgi:hypothetical protein
MSSRTALVSALVVALVPAAAVAAGDGVILTAHSTPTTAPTYVGPATARRASARCRD